MPIAELLWLRDAEHEWVLARKMGNLWGKADVDILAPFERSTAVTLTAENSFPAELSHLSAIESGDLSQLGNAAEAPIIGCVRRRCAIGRIFTWVKPQSVLLCVAPNCDVEQLCQRTRSERPHIWAVADRAVAGPTSTACIMLGDSGSGKTEFANALLRRVVAKSRRAGGGGGSISATDASVASILATHTRQRCALAPSEVAALDSDAEQPRWRAVGMEDVFENCCVCVELFSHARTQTNRNASIFGRHIRVGIRHGAIVGGAVHSFGSGVSRRVTSARTGERNFHIFYAMLRGLPADTLSSLGLKSWDTYQLLRHDPRPEELSLDQGLFARGCEALKFIGIRQREQLDLWRALAGILELGNLQHDGRAPDTEVARRAAEHLGICGGSGVRLLQLLAVRNWSAGSDGDAATEARNTKTLMRVIYRDLFALISQRANVRMRWTEAPPQHFVDVWDAFGVCPGGVYSAFKDLELLVVNYIAERMHFCFTESVYASEEQLYAREGLVIRADNGASAAVDCAPTCRMLTNIFSQLNVMCSRAEGRGEDSPSADCSNQALLWGICSTYGASVGGAPAIANTSLGQDEIDPLAAEARRFTPPSTTDSTHFGVVHYRSKVKYSVANFVEHMLERLPVHLDTECATASNGIIVASRDCRPPPHAESPVLASVREVAATAKTLMRTNRVFCQCIQPNKTGTPYNAPMSCDAPLVSAQLRAFGVLDGVKFARRGYLYRAGHGRFWAMCMARQWARWAELPRSVLSVRRGCEMVLEKALSKKDHGNAFFVGDRLVLLKNEATLEAIADWCHGLVAPRLACFIRARLARIRFVARQQARLRLRLMPMMHSIRLAQSVARAAPSRSDVAMRYRYAPQRAALRAVASRAVLAAAFASNDGDVAASRAENVINAILRVIESAAAAATAAASACARSATKSCQSAENAVRLLVAERADVVAREEHAAARAVAAAQHEVDAQRKLRELGEASDLVQHTWRWIRARRALVQLEVEVKSNAIAVLGSWMFTISCKRELARWRGLMQQACSGGDLRELTRLIDCSASDGFGLLRGVPVAELLDTRVSLPSGETPLLLAARAGNVQAVRVLVASGCSVDAVDAARTHVLHRLCALPNASAAIREVLDYASREQRERLLDTDSLDAPNGRCIFTIASESGGEAVLKCLRDFGVVRASRTKSLSVHALAASLFGAEYAVASSQPATPHVGAVRSPHSASRREDEQQRALDVRAELEALRVQATSLRDQLAAAQRRRAQYRAQGDGALAARALRQIGEISAVQTRTMAQIETLEQYASALRQLPATKAAAHSTRERLPAVKRYGDFSDAMDLFHDDSGSGGASIRRTQSLTALLTGSLRALETVCTRIDRGERRVATARARDDLRLALVALQPTPGK
jgi:hypothetical protein